MLVYFRNIDFWCKAESLAISHTEFHQTVNIVIANNELKNDGGHSNKITILGKITYPCSFMHIHVHMTQRWFKQMKLNQTQMTHL